jgi:hypothetical protein
MRATMAALAAMALRSDSASTSATGARAMRRSAARRSLPGSRINAACSEGAIMHEYCTELRGTETVWRKVEAIDRIALQLLFAARFPLAYLARINATIERLLDLYG